MFENIKAKLKNNGYTPDTILDIGACFGEFTDEMVNIYPDAKYYLFEANNHPELQKYLVRKNIKVHNTALDSKEGVVDWYQVYHRGDSIYKELSKDYVNISPIKKETSVLKDMIDIKDMSNVLIKISCQGSEIRILQGAGHILDITDFILLQVPVFGKYNENAPSFLDYITFMNTLGFIPYDIQNKNNINGFLMSCYFVFINKNHPFNQDVQNKLLNKNIHIILDQYGNKI
jgi:FkbM family methyltransferase